MNMEITKRIGTEIREPSKRSLENHRSGEDSSISCSSGHPRLIKQHCTWRAVKPISRVPSPVCVERLKRPIATRYAVMEANEHVLITVVESGRLFRIRSQYKDQP